MSTTKLIYFMMNLIINEKFVIIRREFFNYFLDVFFIQSIYDFNSIELNHYTSGGTAGDIFNFIGLNTNLNILNLCYERNHYMKTGFTYCVFDFAGEIIYTNISFVNFMDASNNQDNTNHHYSY